MQTYLTDLVSGDHDNFYAHALRWYFPQILKRTYSKYGLGLGIYTMEGYEAINYTTKHLICDHTNRWGNACSQTMVQIVMTYMNNDHNIVTEIKGREKAKKKQIESILWIHNGTVTVTNNDNYDHDNSNNNLVLEQF